MSDLDSAHDNIASAQKAAKESEKDWFTIADVTDRKWSMCGRHEASGQEIIWKTWWDGGCKDNPE